MVNEREMESFLKANGWTIWHPEDHAFVDRFTELSSAEVVLMIEGAFFLSNLFFTRVDTRIFTLARNDDPLFGNDVFFRDFFGIIGREKPLNYHRLNLPKKWVSMEGTSARFELDLTAFRRLMEESRFLDSLDHPRPEIDTAYQHDRRSLTEEAIITLGSVVTTSTEDREHYLGELKALRGDLDGAMDEMRKAVAIEPGKGHQQARLGQLLAEAGWLEGTANALEQAVALAPEGDAAYLNPEGYPPYHIELSEVYQKLKQFDKALFHASIAIDLSPGSAGYHFHRSNLLVLMDDLDGAESDLRRAIKLSPDSIETHLLLAGIHMRREDWNSALRDWEKILEIDPARSDAHYYSGLTRQRMEDFNGARACYLACLSLDPGHE